MKNHVHESLKLRERPNESSIMHQDWRELLFLHWKCDPKIIQKTLPPGLFVDTFNYFGYLTIIPFFIENLHLPHLPPIPGLSNFIEVNVRTYVINKKGIPGIWFYSLDITSLLMARGARSVFSLPYFYSKIKNTNLDDNILIKGKRNDNVEMLFEYKLSNESSNSAKIETLEFFLIERYLLYSFDSKNLYSLRVNHKPYPLQKGSLKSYNSDLLKVNGFNLTDPPDLIHFSRGVNVDIFRMKKEF